MFTGIFTKVLLGILGVSLLWGGFTYVKYNWFDKPAYEKEISDLQEAGIKAQAEKYKLKNEVSFLKKQKDIQKEKVNVKTKLRETIAEPTPDNFVEYSRRFRVRPKSGQDAAKGGTGPGGTDNQPKP